MISAEERAASDDATKTPATFIIVDDSASTRSNATKKRRSKAKYAMADRNPTETVGSRPPFALRPRRHLAPLCLLLRYAATLPTQVSFRTCQLSAIEFRFQSRFPFLFTNQLTTNDNQPRHTSFLRSDADGPPIGVFAGSNTRLSTAHKRIQSSHEVEKGGSREPVYL